MLGGTIGYFTSQWSHGLIDIFSIGPPLYVFAFFILNLDFADDFQVHIEDEAWFLHTVVSHIKRAAATRPPGAGHNRDGYSPRSRRNNPHGVKATRAVAGHHGPSTDLGPPTVPRNDDFAAWSHRFLVFKSYTGLAVKVLLWWVVLLLARELWNRIDAE
jgi:hypothetical protein